MKIGNFEISFIQGLEKLDTKYTIGLAFRPIVIWIIINFPHFKKVFYCGYLLKTGSINGHFMFKFKGLYDI